MSAPVFVVLGAGMQGTCAAYDLLRAGAAEVRIADFDAAAAARSAARVAALVPGGKIIGVQADARHPETFGPLLEGAHALLSAVPYFLNPPVAQACADHGVGYCDLGGNTEVSGRVLALDGVAKAKDITLVPDCGLAPGLGNTLAAAAIGRIPNVQEVRIYCGGLPQSPEPPFGYHLVFSVDGLLNEYAGFADALRDDELIRVPALDDVENVDFPGIGALEGFATSGGTSTCPKTFRGKVRTLEYKTLRYPGHIAMIRAYRELGLFSEAPITVNGHSVVPRQVFASLLKPMLVKPEAKDLVVLMVTARGEKDGKSVTGRWTLIDRHDDATGFTAMERSTAFPAAVVAWMIATGQCTKGAVPLETGVPPERFLELLAQRDLVLRWEQIEG